MDVSGIFITNYREDFTKEFTKVASQNANKKLPEIINLSKGYQVKAKIIFD